MNMPIISDDPLYHLLRNGFVDKFNAMREQGNACDLRGCDLRGLDLRELHAAGLDLGNCHLQHTDLRGVDLSRTNLEGANINGAKIAGAYFPAELGAEEINLSLLHGTRMRYRR
jgi:uncharacterized protein YjbI with pentapeptide repeats